AAPAAPHQTARQLEAESPTGGDAVDRHDDRLVATAESRDGAVQVGRELLDVGADAAERVHEVLHVAARTEGATGAGDHDAAHVGILVQLELCLEQAATESQVERVVGVGAIEGEGGDVILPLHGQVLIRHGILRQLGGGGGQLRVRAAISATASSTVWICSGLTRTRSTPWV